MTDDGEIVFPKEWKALSAPETRFQIMFELYGICHWNDVTYAERRDKYIIGFFDTFRDEGFFTDDLDLIIGVSIFKDETEYLVEFLSAFELFLNELEISSLKIKQIDAKMFRTTIFIPNRAIELAGLLYSKMIEHGDPGINSYY